MFLSAAAALLFSMSFLPSAEAQSMQFCVYNKYGQKQGGCYLDKKACENVVASYNKSNASMGLLCQPEKR
jgi:hypothetical protein